MVSIIVKSQNVLQVLGAFIALALLLAFGNANAQISMGQNTWGLSGITPTPSAPTGSLAFGGDSRIYRVPSSGSNPFPSAVMSSDATGGVNFQRAFSARMTSPLATAAAGAVEVPFVESVALPAANIAKGAAKFARATIPSLLVGVAAEALIDYGIYKCNQPSGWCYKDPTTGVYNWKASPSNSTASFSTAQQACSASASYWDAAEPSYTPHTMSGVRQLNATSYVCLGTVPQVAGTWQYSSLLQGQAVPVERDSTQADFEEAYRQKMTQQPLKGKELYDLIQAQMKSAEDWQNTFGDPRALNGTMSQVGSVGPSSTPLELGRSTQQNADGTISTSVTTSQTRFGYSVDGSTVGDQSVSVTPITTNTTITTNNTTGSTTTNTTTINNNGTPSPAPASVSVVTCGLPGKPPCKMDETGTPDGKTESSSWLDKVTAAFKVAKDAIADVVKPRNFSLPMPQFFPSVSCSAITWGQLRGTSLTFDPCTGVLASIHSLLAWFYGVMAAILIYKKTVNSQEK